MGHHLLGVEVGGEIAGRIIAGVGIGHVAGQHALQASRLHRSQPHGLAQQTHLSVKAHVDQVRESILLAERVHLGLRVGHPIVGADDQVRVHAIPTVITAATFSTAGASPGIGHRRAGDVHRSRHGHLGQIEHTLPLGISHVVVHDITRAKEDRQAHFAGRSQSLVDARHEGIHPHGGGLAPVVVPDVYRYHADARRIHLLVSDIGFARLGIAGLQAPADRDR